MPPEISRSHIINISDPNLVEIPRQMLHDMIPKDISTILIIYEDVKKILRIIPVETNYIAKITLSVDNHAPPRFFGELGKVLIRNNIQTLHSTTICHEHIVVDYIKYIQISELTDTTIRDLVELFKPLVGVIEVKGEIMIV